jgi:hypothetical protein
MSPAIGTSSISATDALDHLYAAPLADFVGLRKRLAAELRGAGDVAGATEVSAAKKPSRTAWVLNQVALRDPKVLRTAVDAHTEAARAQAHGDAEAMRETRRGFRDALGEVARRSAAIAVDGGAALSAMQVRKLGETVRAAIAGPSRDRLLAGRLTEDVEVDDPFAGLEVGSSHGGASRSATPTPHTQSAASRAREREAERAREARERAAEQSRKRIEALEQEARDARATAREAEVAARRAADEADRARRAATAVEERLEKARKGVSG